MNPPAVVPDLTTGWTQRTAAAIARVLARWYFSLEVRGLENLPVAEPCLLCANHTSHVDTFALASATGHQAASLVFLAAHDYFSKFRFRGWLLRRLLCLLPFERGSGMGPAKHNLAMLGACRDAGRIIVLFPEGTRSPNGVMREFKPGVAMFADKLGVRVVPCRIEGAHAALPKGRKLPRRTRLRVTFGPALSLAPGAANESAPARTARYQRFAAELQAAVADLGDVRSADALAAAAAVPGEPGLSSPSCPRP